MLCYIFANQSLQHKLNKIHDRAAIYINKNRYLSMFYCICFTYIFFLIINNIYGFSIATPATIWKECDWSHQEQYLDSASKIIFTLWNAGSFIFQICSVLIYYLLIIPMRFFSLCIIWPNMNENVFFLDYLLDMANGILYHAVLLLVAIVFIMMVFTSMVPKLKLWCKSYGIWLKNLFAILVVAGIYLILFIIFVFHNRKAQQPNLFKRLFVKNELYYLDKIFAILTLLHCYVLFLYLKILLGSSQTNYFIRKTGTIRPQKIPILKIILT